MKVALCLRVATEGQITANRRAELERVAEAHDWLLAQAYEDNGVSGAKGREHRKQFDSLLRAATWWEFDMVAAWSAGRLGRSPRDLIDFLNELRGAGGARARSTSRRGYSPSLPGETPASVPTSLIICA
jgi:DNA invertase Pin-like site-specific DNA recombinase